MEEPVEGAAVRRGVLLAFEYSYLHDDWVCPLADALAGVTAEEAAWTIGHDLRSIWEIVLHMTAWTENIVQRGAQRLRGENPGRPSEGAWPPLPATPDEVAWEDAKRRLWDAMNAMRGYITTTPIAAMLDQGAVGYSQLDDLLCRFTHNAYHIGQITKLREWRAGQNGLSRTVDRST